MKVIVKATKQELHDMGICSPGTFKWLMDGKPKEVTEENYTAFGRRMLYLKRDDDTGISTWIGWVWEDFVEVVEQNPPPRYKPQHLGIVAQPDADKVGVEPHLPGGIRALNEALGLPKFHHRADGGQLGLVRGEREDKANREETTSVQAGLPQMD